jgi:hypothetical protein
MTNATRTAGIGCVALLVAVLTTPLPALAEAQSEPVPGVDPDQSLSEQLDENNGVIEPPSIGDAGIHAPAPDPDPGTTPVIPPPGTPGGDPTVHPK